MIFRRRRPRSEPEPEPAEAADVEQDAVGEEEAGGSADEVVPSDEQAGPATPEEPAAAEDADSPVRDEATESGGSDEEPPRIGIRESVRQVRRALAPLGTRRVVVAGLGLTGLVVAGIFAFTAFSFWWTSQPSFCSRCHVMKPYVAAWEGSPHRDVNCESCHLTPGVFGFIGGKIAGLQVVMNYIRGEYEDYSFNAAVSNASCLQCHETILERNIHSGGIRVSHKNIIEMGGKCLSCHSTVAHDGPIKVGSETHPSMTNCLQCHNDQIAPLECSLCHINRSRQPTTEGTEPAPVPTGG